MRRTIAERGLAVLSTRCEMVVLHARIEEVRDALDIPSIATNSVCPALSCQLGAQDCRHTALRGELSGGPNPIVGAVVLSAMGNRDDEPQPLPPIPPTRDDRAREAMALAPEMSPREACMRVLLRRCAIQIMRVSAIVALLVARDASAHSLDIGYLRIEANRVILDLDRAAAAQMLDAPSATSEALHARANDLASMTYAREAPATASGACTIGEPAMELSGVTVRLTASIACPDGERTWRFPFVTDTHVSATFELLVKDAATDRMIVVDRASPTVTFGAATAKVEEQTTASLPRRGGGRSMFLIGGLLVGVMLAPLARFALRR